MAHEQDSQAGRSARDAGEVAEDVVLPHSPTEDGAGYHVLRKRGETLEAGVVRAVREGQPLHGELVRLRPREGTPLFDVEVEYDARASSQGSRAPASRGRPPKVATRAFRAGWDEIWGGQVPEDEEPS